MPLKVLIIPDKFKGTLTARAAAEAIARGWHRARPGDALRLMPMSDGGDGFGEVMSALLHAKGQTVRTVDAAHRACVGGAGACGWEFFDEGGSRIERWTDLGRLERIRAPRVRWCFRELVVAVDVQNPLLGPRGATRVYEPQKGLRCQDFELAERSLRRLGQVFKEELGRDFAREPGAGAAGGLGFGLLAFLGARLEPGFDMFARYTALEHRLRSADLVVTGEGAIDDSTLMGKGVGQVMQRCGELGIPCIAA